MVRRTWGVLPPCFVPVVLKVGWCSLVCRGHAAEASGAGWSGVAPTHVAAKAAWAMIG